MDNNMKWLICKFERKCVYSFRLTFNYIFVNTLSIPSDCTFKKKLHDVMATRDNNEFKFALRDIAAHAPKLYNPYDRVRCSEWARKLASLPDDNLESCKVRNEYIQFLRIQVRNNFLHGPFTSPPPETNLCPLAENLGNMMAHQIPNLPRTGPIAPMLHHASPDGRAFVSARQIPGGGVLCYMAVSPEGFD